MLVGEGPAQLGGDFGAVERAGHDAQIVVEHPDVESGEVKDLEHTRVAQQAAQVGRVIAAGRCELHEVAVTVAARDLHQAEPVAVGVQAHGFGVDRNRIAEGQAGRQIALVEVERHGLMASVLVSVGAPVNSAAPGNGLASRG